MKLANKALLIAALGAAIAAPAFSQDDSSALFADQPTGSSTSAAKTPAAAQSADASAGSDFTLSLAGNHEFGYRLPANDASNFSYVSDNGTDMKVPYFSNEYDVTVKDKDVKFMSNWNVTLEPSLTDGGNTSWSDLVTAKPLENYVSWSPSGWKLTGGYQIFSWGVADKRNPTDNLNPRDYTVGVNADKIPVLAADAIWYPSDAFSVEGVFLPSSQSSEYPVNFETAAVSGVAQVSSSVEQQALATVYAKLAAQYGTAYATSYVNTLASSYSITSNPTDGTLNLDVKNFIAGAKLNYHSAALDASVSYLYDIDPLYTPVFSVSYNAYSLPSSVTYSLERERLHRFGLDAKTTIAKFGLWTEACYTLTPNTGSDDYAYRKSDLNYVIGADVNFGPNDVGYVNLQYIGTWIPGYDDSFYKDLKAGKITDPTEAYERALVNGLGLQTEGLLQGVTTNIKYELADGAFTPQITAVYVVPFLYDDTNETRYGSLALNPEIDVKPVDSFHIILGVDLAYAWVKTAGSDSVSLDTTTDKIGVYTSSNNVYLKILYKWNYDLKK
jgi:hypothetical protein